MDFYRWNGNTGKSHISIDMDGPVCGNNTMMHEAKELFRLMSNGYVRSLDFPSNRYGIKDIITCKTCLRWFWKQRWIERDKIGAGIYL